MKKSKHEMVQREREAEGSWAVGSATTMLMMHPGLLLGANRAVFDRPFLRCARLLSHHRRLEAAPMPNYRGG